MRRISLSGLVLLLGLALPIRAQVYEQLLPQPLLAEEDTAGRHTAPDFSLDIRLANDSLSALRPALTRFERTFAAEEAPALPLRLSCAESLLFSSSPEAYRLEVTPEEIRLEGRTLAALHAGLQTLRQLVTDRGIACGVVEDAPAFPWRGFMVDVGRNYQSVALLKEQIDVMAKLKLNVLHLHLTEDVAWRVESRRHPELNAPETMTRHKGLFYRWEELRELRRYCAERFILLVPELDMPGHSAAFERALEYGMQSTEGSETVLDLLDEFLDELPVPIIHIGADEVRITDESFVPAVTRDLEERGVSVIGWSPGGNYPATVIRQLWSAAERSEIDNPDVDKIDSRNLYINHMDPLESVVSIYNHALLDRESGEGDPHLLGGELCIWNDRHLPSEQLTNLHNPTYPAMITFAERSWVGGGGTDNRVSISSDAAERERFGRFEQRLMRFRDREIPELPFPYHPQAEIEWRLFGPYDNGGDPERSFPIETTDPETLRPDTICYGGTLIYRHFWDPEIKGLMTNPKPNQTIYAYRRIWSDREREAKMWIGFYDYSRSQWPDAFALGSWNALGATIRLNGQAIAPPLWAHAGQTADPEIPYFDENYSMRPPTVVRLKKGWNTLLLKVPVTTFESAKWYAPVKWMSTALFLDLPEK